MQIVLEEVFLLLVFPRNLVSSFLSTYSLIADSCISFIWNLPTNIGCYTFFLDIFQYVFHVVGGAFLIFVLFMISITSFLGSSVEGDHKKSHKNASCFCGLTLRCQYFFYLSGYKISFGPWKGVFSFLSSEARNSNNTNCCSWNRFWNWNDKKCIRYIFSSCILLTINVNVWFAFQGVVAKKLSVDMLSDVLQLLRTSKSNQADQIAKVIRKWAKEQRLSIN